MFSWILVYYQCHTVFMYRPLPIAFNYFLVPGILPFTNALLFSAMFPRTCCIQICYQWPAVSSYVTNGLLYPVMLTMDYLIQVTNGLLYPVMLPMACFSQLWYQWSVVSSYVTNGCSCIRLCYQ